MDVTGSHRALDGLTLLERDRAYLAGRFLGGAGVKAVGQDENQRQHEGEDAKSADGSHLHFSFRKRDSTDLHGWK